MKSSSSTCRAPNASQHPGHSLERRKRSPGIFDLEQLAAASVGFNGSELEQAVIGSMYAAFQEGTKSKPALVRRVHEDSTAIRFDARKDRRTPRLGRKPLRLSD